MAANRFSSAFWHKSANVERLAGIIFMECTRVHGVGLVGALQITVDDDYYYLIQNTKKRTSI